MAGNDADIASLSYEESRDELVAIVAKLEAGAATLEESLGLWERGEALAARCQELLDGARDRITASRGDDEDDAADAGVIGIIPADEDGDS
ncbi:exodeoxyribonuclease VII small subunit [Demequina sp. NBRC 110057]|uniref:exodeoxyribonuclease VII small subunit n=1 Tax=Demequina sp. NBRC 110057 TaxID=1570346 RepID=UPI00117779F8|nr:exodeoxyribonuclease VII small subunit [Demequina sp. NBRC 110057]